jgi:hypothetical protein
MGLLDILKSEAVQRELIKPSQEIDPRTVYTLVRDMPYKRASDRQPETLIREWRGTCSGKHYLLKELFAELGYSSKVIACTNVTVFDLEKEPDEVREILESVDGRFVDVHNYLLLGLPEGEMIVDATWPRSAKKYNLLVNETFELGVDQRIACEPIKTWIVPEDEDPQDFKEQLLRENFTAEELVARNAFIQAIGNWLN